MVNVLIAKHTTQKKANYLIAKGRKDVLNWVILDTFKKDKSVF